MGQTIADHAVCLAMEGVYLDGVPNTNTQASLSVGFEAFSGVNETGVNLLENSELALHLTFS